MTHCTTVSREAPSRHSASYIGMHAAVALSTRRAHNPSYLQADLPWYPRDSLPLWALDIRMDRMTMHGFRAMARTILDEVLDFRPDFIEHQLAHAVRDPNGRAYNRTVFLPERRRMMQVWADYLDRLKAGEEIDTRPPAYGPSDTFVFYEPDLRLA